MGMKDQKSVMKDENYYIYMDYPEEELKKFVKKISKVFHELSELENECFINMMVYDMATMRDRLKNAVDTPIC